MAFRDKPTYASLVQSLNEIHESVNRASQSLTISRPDQTSNVDHIIKRDVEKEGRTYDRDEKSSLSHHRQR